VSLEVVRYKLGRAHGIENVN